MAVARTGNDHDINVHPGRSRHSQSVACLFVAKTQGCGSSLKRSEAVEVGRING